MKQNAPWSAWFKREAVHLYWSLRRQWCLWRMWRLPDHRSEKFKALFRETIRSHRNY